MQHTTQHPVQKGAFNKHSDHLDFRTKDIYMFLDIYLQNAREDIQEKMISIKFYFAEEAVEIIKDILSSKCLFSGNDDNSNYYIIM